MDIINCNEKELAKQLVSFPQLYNTLSHGFQSLILYGLLTKEVRGSVDKTLSLLNTAHSIALNSQYFVFDTSDGWTERTGECAGGYTIFKKVEDELIEALGLSCSGVPRYDEVVDFLDSAKIKKVYTVEIPMEGYFGLKQTNEDGDGDITKYLPIDKNTFKEKSIEVILINPLV